MKNSLPSPLREKITLFESLNRPATRAAHNLRKMASTTSTQIWRRLSGSFDKELDKTPATSHDGAGAGPSHTSAKEEENKKKKEKKKDESRAAHGRSRVVESGRVARGFEPARNIRPSLARESTFFVQGTISRVPRGVVTRRQQQQHQHQQMQRTRAARGGSDDAPSLPDLDFEVDGAADGGTMLGMFEREFNILFSFTGHSRRGGKSGATTDGSGGNGSGGVGDENTNPRPAVVVARAHRNNHPEQQNTAKSRASPVPSIRSARGLSGARRPPLPPPPPAIPPRNPDRMTMRKRPATPAPAMNRDGGFCDNRRPPPPVVDGGMVRVDDEDCDDDDGMEEEEMVVSSAQCGLAHPRPSRVLDVRRFVGYCRETARTRGVGRVVGKL